MFSSHSPATSGTAPTAAHSAEVGFRHSHPGSTQRLLRGVSKPLGTQYLSLLTAPLPGAPSPASGSRKKHGDLSACPPRAPHAQVLHTWHIRSYIPSSHTPSRNTPNPGHLSPPVWSPRCTVAPQVSLPCRGSLLKCKPDYVAALGMSVKAFPGTPSLPDTAPVHFPAMSLSPLPLTLRCVTVTFARVPQTATPRPPHTTSQGPSPHLCWDNLLTLQASTPVSSEKSFWPILPRGQLSCSSLPRLSSKAGIILGGRYVLRRQWCL